MLISYCCYMGGFFMPDINTNIDNLLNSNNYDVRVSHNARWIDQKCTVDVINFVCDCIINYIDTNNSDSIKFSKNDIWHSEYANEWVEQLFNKPNTESALSENEYDKFFSQPLKLLAYAGVLKEEKKSNTNIYQVKSREIIEYISMKEVFTANFLTLYIEKVLKDSGIYYVFEEFFKSQDKISFYKMKQYFTQFTIKNTRITKDTECYRIFTKVVNPLAWKKRKYGTKRGNLSKSIITFAELLYNRENFRDISSNKPKGVTRVEWNKRYQKKVNKNYFEYQSKKAVEQLRKYNKLVRNGKSELQDEWGNGDATNIHHIFPRHLYPEISMYYENLIAITPTQHYTKAHPNNNTSMIDEDYQEALLMSKAVSIKENIENPKVDTIYSFDNLVYVINEGRDCEYDTTGNNYATAMNVINDAYTNKKDNI